MMMRDRYRLFVFILRLDVFVLGNIPVLGYVLHPQLLALENIQCATLAGAHCG